MSLDDLYPDANYPGLRVCRDDLDDYDPYRLPARQPEVITLQYPRPDTPLDAGPASDVGIFGVSLWGGAVYGSAA
jgi:hypothetical protein